MFIQFKSEYFTMKPGQRQEVPDAQAEPLIAAGIAEKVAGNPLQDQVTKEVSGVFEQMLKGLDTQIAAAIKEIGKAQSLSRKGAAGRIFGEHGEGDPKRCFGDWCLAVATMGASGASMSAKQAAAARLEKVYGSQRNEWDPETKAALAEGSGITGGYTVPPDFYDQILAVGAEMATFRKFGFVLPMASATMQFPYLDITTAQSAGNSPFFAGVIANWTQEAQTRTEVEPQFKMMELKAQELSGYSVASNVMLQDSAASLEKLLVRLFGLAVAWYEEYAFLQGNGAGKPLGVLNAPATIKVNRNTPSHFYFPDLAGMLAKLLPSSYDAAHWYISPSVVVDLLQLKDGANRALFVSIDQGATQKPVWKLLNLPVHVTEKLPALGTLGDVMLLDPSYYVIGDRQRLEIAYSDHVNFLKNQATWRFVQRVDGRPWLDNAITLQDASTQVSPFVALN